VVAIIAFGLLSSCKAKCVLRLRSLFLVGLKSLPKRLSCHQSAANVLAACQTQCWNRHLLSFHNVLTLLFLVSAQGAAGAFMFLLCSF
jgi:hypothetical protein